jgi:ammonia channel protein AmtB
LVELSDLASLLLNQPLSPQFSGLLGAEDVGGSITIHMFGAIFGLAVSYVLGPPKPSSSSNNAPNATSDLTAFIGTTLLWVYWPSFVGTYTNHFGGEGFVFSRVMSVIVP